MPQVKEATKVSIASVKRDLPVGATVKVDRKEYGVTRNSESLTLTRKVKKNPDQIHYPWKGCTAVAVGNKFVISNPHTDNNLTITV